MTPAQQPQQEKIPEYRVDKRVRGGKYTVLRDNEPFAETFVHVDAVRITMAMEIAHKEIRSQPHHSERDATLNELATFLDNADNTSDSGNAQKWVSLSVLFQWMQSKGWEP